MGIIDKWFGKGKKEKTLKGGKTVKPNVEKLKEEKDIEGLFQALEYRSSSTEDSNSKDYHKDLWFQNDAVTALTEIGDIDILLRIMKNYKKVPGKVIDCYFSSHSDKAFDCIRQKYKTLPEQAVSILIESARSNDALTRYEAYQNLGRAYPQASATDKPKIYEVLKRAMEIEHGVSLKGAQYGFELMSEYFDANTQKKEKVPFLMKNLNDPSRAEELISILGLESVPLFVEAMKSSDIQIVHTAAWALSHPLMKMSTRYDQKNLHDALVPAINYLQSVIKAAEIMTGAQSYDHRVTIAVTTLGKIGDNSAISVLEELLSKVNKNVQEKGIHREYVNTGIAAGFISNKDDIRSIQEAINSIKERER